MVYVEGKQQCLPQIKPVPSLSLSPHSPWTAEDEEQRE